MTRISALPPSPARSGLCYNISDLYSQQRNGQNQKRQTENQLTLQLDSELQIGTAAGGRSIIAYKIVAIQPIKKRHHRVPFSLSLQLT
jgi:hypothetical protein